MTKIAILITFDLDEQHMKPSDTLFRLESALNTDEIFKKYTANGDINFLSYCCHGPIKLGICENCGNSQHLSS